MQDQFLECASCNGSRGIYHKFCLPESKVKIFSNGDWFCLTCIKYFEESFQDECEDSDFEEISTVQYAKRANKVAMQKYQQRRGQQKIISIPIQARTMTPNQNILKGYKHPHH